MHPSLNSLQNGWMSMPVDQRSPRTAEVDVGIAINIDDSIPIGMVGNKRDLSHAFTAADRRIDPSWDVLIHLIKDMLALWT
jgi:hypothetical protein